MNTIVSPGFSLSEIRMDRIVKWPKRWLVPTTTMHYVWNVLAIIIIIIAHVVSVTCLLRFFFTAPERQDFNNSVITVIFEADEFGNQVNDVPVPVPIADDEIDEAQEEVFVIDLTLQSSINSQISIARRSSLARINDDDGEYFKPCVQNFLKWHQLNTHANLPLFSKLGLRGG